MYKKYKLLCEIYVSIEAEDIDKAEEVIKERFNNIVDTEFRQLIDYTIE